MTNLRRNLKPAGSNSSRRTFLSMAAGAAAVTGACSQPDQELAAAEAKLPLEEFQPKSMLVVPQNPVARAAHPVIDAHTHVSSVFNRPGTPDSPLHGPPAEQFDQIVRWLDDLNIQALVNLTGGAGEELDRTVSDMVKPHPGRLVTCTVPTYERIREPDYPTWQADELKRAKEAGAIGLKISKTLGLRLRENIKEGPLVKVDDPRFDPMWEVCGELGFPVFIHVSDPDAFFTPIDHTNERWEELANHPDWSFYGKDYPPKVDILAARNRVMARHPNTQFICLHVANRSENLDEVSSCFDQYPNMHCEIGARLGELGRQPRRSRKFFEKYQDRIMFGTDASPNGVTTPQQVLIPEMYQCYFRFLETLDEYFDYAPAPVPPQGRWKIYGIGLPDGILKKVYHDNAARLLGWPAA